MDEGIKFTPEDQSIALAKCSPQAQLEVRCAMLVDRVTELMQTNSKLQATIDQLTKGGDDGQ